LADNQTVTFRCPQCERLLRVEMLSPDQQVMCPQCNGTFPMPGTTPVPGSQPTAAPQLEPSAGFIAQVEPPAAETEVTPMIDVTGGQSAAQGELPVVDSVSSASERVNRRTSNDKILSVIFTIIAVVVVVCIKVYIRFQNRMH